MDLYIKYGFTEQQSPTFVENNKELVLYTNSMQDSNLNTIFKDFPYISSIDEACPDIYSRWRSFANSYVPDNFSEDS